MCLYQFPLGKGGAVLQRLSCAVQTECEYIRQRQAEGIAAAEACRVRSGRKPKHQYDDFTAVFSEWESGATSARTASKRLNADRKTFIKWIGQSMGGKSTLFPPT